MNTIRYDVGYVGNGWGTSPQSGGDSPHRSRDLADRQGLRGGLHEVSDRVGFFLQFLGSRVHSAATEFVDF